MPFTDPRAMGGGFWREYDIQVEYDMPQSSNETAVMAVGI